MRAHSPTALAQALGFLAADPGLRPIAGCTDLLVATPEARDELPGVLDLLRLPELRGIREADGAVEIGAATSFSEIRDSALLARHAPALVAAASEVGGRQIQNRATIGGNAVNASPAGDSLPVLLALAAEVVVAGAAGERTIAYHAFHLGYRRVALEPGELVVRFRIPIPPEGARQGFRKVGTRRAQAISKVVVAASVELDGDAVRALRLGAGSVAETPVRLRAAEAIAAGRPADLATAEAVARAAASEVEPIDDVRSTAAYRRFALERVVRRLLLELFA